MAAPILARSFRLFNRNDVRGFGMRSEVNNVIPLEFTLFGTNAFDGDVSFIVNCIVFKGGKIRRRALNRLGESAVTRE